MTVLVKLAQELFPPLGEVLVELVGPGSLTKTGRRVCPKQTGELLTVTPDAVVACDGKYWLAGRLVARSEPTRAHWYGKTYSGTVMLAGRERQIPVQSLRAA